MMIARTLSLIPALLIAAAAHALAQPITISPRHSSIEPGLQGEVIVKITRAAFAGERITPAIFGEAAARYGFSSVTPWVDPKMLWAGTPLYKQNDAASNEMPEHEIARIMVVHYSSLDEPDRVVEALEKMKVVEYAEPVYPRMPLYAPNDPEIGKQWYLNAINAQQAWDVVRADSSIIIAITDTGIDPEHEDLKDAIWHNYGEMGNGPDGDKRFDGKDNDGDGKVDDWWGWDFAGANGTSEDNDPTGIEEHGTEVAGVAAAEGDNHTGIAGIAFGAKIMVVKVGDDHVFPNNRIYNGANGILYAAMNGARIINCSWGGVNRSRSEEDMIRMVINKYHPLIVAAAGNDSDESTFYPASYPGVLSVGALTEGGDKASFSNYNYRIDLSSPGTDIYSTGLGSSYVYDRGTSFSTPMVTGLAALVWKRYPTYTAEQVAEAMRATASDLSTTLNPAYAGMMGSGLLNLQGAVTEGDQIASARMTGYTIDESIPDGAVEAGETIRIRATIKNILIAAPGVSATLTSVTDSTIGINGPSLKLGAMQSGGSLLSPDTVFQLTIPANTPPNTDLVFKLSVTTKDRTNDSYITIRAVPTYLTTTHNDVAVTFNSSGNIGHNGINQLEGDGFIFNGGDDMLYHGGLMIGYDAEHLSDAVRVGALEDGVSKAFEVVKPYRLHLSQDSSVEIGTASFNDSANYPENRVGIDVDMTTYEYRAPSASNFVIVAYRIYNRSGAALHGLRCGLYLDWDVSASAYSDEVAYDAAHRLAYQRDASGDPGSPYVGAALLTGQEPSFYAVDNDLDSTKSAFYLGRKWATLSSGIHENNTIDDMAMVIGGGPIDLAPNAWTDVAFALLAHPSFDTLRAAADRARELFVPSGVAIPGIANAPASFAQPNPFAGTTTIHVTAPRTGASTLAIYNLRGEKVSTLLEGTVNAGEHTYLFDAAALPDGVYMYEFENGGIIQRGKIVKMR